VDREKAKSAARDIFDCIDSIAANAAREVQGDHERGVSDPSDTELTAKLADALTAFVAAISPPSEPAKAKP
jgi:hypothetical protein